MTEDCFRIRGSVLTTFILDLLSADTTALDAQLAAKVAAAPDFFKQSPILINLEKFESNGNELSIQALLKICRQHGLVPIGFKACPVIDDLALSTEISEAGLAVLSEQKSRPQAQHENKTKEKPNSPAQSKVIEKTVRSGQQVYADKGDLIIVGSVSGGAEVLADGNIHIYGTLRGRALAGVNGNTEARIFCYNNQAELVSIAGHFLLSESLEKLVWQQPAQFFLDDQRLQVQAVS